MVIAFVDVELEGVFLELSSLSQEAPQSIDVVRRGRTP
jgi:hypothetical protein